MKLHLQWRDYWNDGIRHATFNSLDDMYRFIDDAAADSAPLLDYEWVADYSVNTPSPRPRRVT